MNPRREFFRIGPDQPIEMLKAFDVVNVTAIVETEIASDVELVDRSGELELRGTVVVESDRRPEIFADVERFGSGEDRRDGPIDSSLADFGSVDGVCGKGRSEPMDWTGIAPLHDSMVGGEQW